MRKSIISSVVAAFVLVVGASSASAGSIGLVPDNGCIAYAGVYFCDADIQSTGTGIFDPFLRVQSHGNNTSSSGWNTDADKKDWDDPNDADDAWTSALALADLQSVDGPDGPTAPSYYLFTVDINQEGRPEDPSSLISLTHFQLFNCADNDYTSLGAGSGCTSFLNLFDGSTWVDFNYRNHQGSGGGDIDVYVPTAGFAGPYIALLDGWGTPPGTYADNDGFQEWAALIGSNGDGGSDDPLTPEPTALLLLGSGLALASIRLRRKRA